MVTCASDRVTDGITASCQIMLRLAAVLYFPEMWYRLGFIPRGQVSILVGPTSVKRKLKFLRVFSLKQWAPARLETWPVVRKS